MLSFIVIIYLGAGYDVWKSDAMSFASHRCWSTTPPHAHASTAMQAPPCKQCCWRCFHVGAQARLIPCSNARAGPTSATSRKRYLDFFHACITRRRPTSTSTNTKPHTQTQTRMSWLTSTNTKPHTQTRMSWLTSDHLRVSPCTRRNTHLLAHMVQGAR